MAQRQYSKGLEHRMRDRDGEVRKRLSDFELAAIRDDYGLDSLFFEDNVVPVDRNGEPTREVQAASGDGI